MIKLSNSFIIRGDENNFTLCKIKVAEKGENEGRERESVVGYYGTLVQAFERYLTEIERLAIQDVGLDVKQAITALKNAHRDILDEVKSLARTSSTNK